MSQSASDGVTGGFGDKATERSVVEDSSVRGVVQDVVISRRVEYYSGSVGRGPKHTGSVDVVERWEERDNRDIRKVGVDPSVYLDVYVEPLGETVRVDMSPSEVVQFGEFMSLNGRFSLTEEEVEVKVDIESVEFECFGSYSRVGEMRDTMTYSEWCSQRRRVFDRGYECGEVIEERLRSAWAKKKGIHSELWTVSNVDDPEYSSSAKVTVEHPEVAEELSFRISMNDWEENEALRKLVDEDAFGLPSNLEQQKVFVSVAEYDGVVAENGSWKLYRRSVMPLKTRVTDAGKGLVDRLFSW